MFKYIEYGYRMEGHSDVNTPLEKNVATEKKKEISCFLFCHILINLANLMEETNAQHNP
ncbi:MAG: hypothetical protein ABFD82_12790 [Syntrophaceae bacterium]